MTEGYFKYKSFNVFYRTAGSGTPLILLHGFGEDGEVWQQQVAALSSTAFVITPDFIGSGKSVLSPEDFTAEDIKQLNSLEFQADAIKALLQHLNINQCIMLGHSMGGYITLAFAEKHPDLLKGFGLIHSTSFADSNEKKENRKRGIALMEEHGGFSFLKNTIPNLFTASYKKEYPSEVNGLIEKAKGFQTKSLQCYYQAMINRPDRTTVLKEAKVPVLIVAGEQDIVVPINDSLFQSHQPNTCQINVLKNTAHMGMWEAATVMNGAITTFLKLIEDVKPQ